MHSFAKKAPHAGALLKGNTLSSFMAASIRCSNTVEAIEVFEVGSYKDYGLLDGGMPTRWSPKYFGGSIEFLAETFFEEFGAAFNMGSIVSTDDFESTETDGGVDHVAKSLVGKKMSSGINAQPNAPVFIQTKGVTNPKYIFKTNDGARLPNFFMNARAKATKTGHAYQARYVLFTTGKGIHHVLDNNSGNVLEVIGYKKIKSFVDNNVAFWDRMRSKMGVDQQLTSVLSSPDVEFELIEDNS